MCIALIALSLLACTAGAPKVVASPTPASTPSATVGPGPSPGATDTGDGALRSRDIYTQVPVSTLDLLIVVDNSAPMGPVQGSLQAGVTALTDALVAGDVDVQAAVIHTSVEGPDAGTMLGTPSVLLGGTPSALGDRLLVGTAGSAQVRAMEAASLALHPNMLTTANIGFRRSNAHLGVLFVSTKDDCSHAGALDGQPASACATGPLVDITTWLDDYESAAGGAYRLHLAAIVDRDGSCGIEGQRYRALMALSEGSLASACDSDLSASLARAGSRFAGLRDQFRLSVRPEPGTLRVLLDGSLLVESPTDGWTWDPDFNTVTTHGSAIPPAGVDLVVTYLPAP